MRRRSLVLRHETLAELTADDLGGIAGAAIPSLPAAGGCLQQLSKMINYTHCLCPTEVRP